MMGRMKAKCKPTGRRRVLAVLLGMVLLASAAVAQGATRQEIEEELTYKDARLVGYPQNVYLDGGTATTWFLLVFLGVVGFSVLFKDAKRTHLD